MKRERRLYQQVVQVAQQQTRTIGLYWARRCRKSTTLGEIYFEEMSKEPGRTVIGCSASLLLGKELVGMTLTAIEQAEILASEAAAVRGVLENGAAEHGLDFQVADSGTGKVLKGMSQDDFASLYQARKMELRLYFDNTSYSRELILAPSVSTFRSYRALVGFDEIGYMESAAVRDLIVSADAMMRDTRDRKMLFASNLCLSDSHPWYEMTMPREITAPTEEDQFAAKPEGHLYIGQGGMLIHRVALKDAYAAGHLLYDDRGAAMDYETCRRFPQLRAGWDVSYALNHKPGGASVVDLISLLNGMRRGVGKTNFVYADSDADIQRAVESLYGTLTTGPVTIGIDQASTTSELSNPTSITVTERAEDGLRYQRLVLVFKTKKRQFRDDVLRRICAVVQKRPAGGPVRRIGIDASNDRLAAEETADDFRGIAPVQLIISGNVVDPRPPGYSEKDGNVNYKTYLCDLHATAINDNKTITPSDPYIKDDYRLVMKDGPRVICTPDPQTGAHGDTFDSGKIADYMQEGSTGALTAETVKQIFTGGNRSSRRLFIPRRHAA